VKLAVDASAILAILFDEPDSESYLSKLLDSSPLWISAVNWWEVQAHAQGRYGEPGRDRSAAFMESIELRVEPVTAEHARVALDTFHRYRGRPARLNMGDCFAYALARMKDAPLLYKGEDFSHTDIARA
jgi:ribonuclease VapC